MTKPESLGEMTLSTLEGEAGHQRKEVDRLARWIQADGRPDVVCLSNALLVGLVRRIREVLGPVKVVVSLQGEDSFLDSLPEPHRSRAWEIVSERCRDVDAFIPVSRTFGGIMTRRLDLDPDRVHAVHPGIRVDDHVPADSAPASPVIGYLARMTEAKGLVTLVTAFLAMREEDRLPGLRLRIAGSMTAADHGLVSEQKERIRAAGQAAQVDWLPNLTREEKLEFLRSLSVLSVPANHGEDFGLYVIEALASGVPVVQPDHGAFPELIAATGGGTLCAPDDPADLARALTELLLDPARARSLGAAGRAAVRKRFTVPHMTRKVLAVFERILAT
jgi:glycosyltransferase involved in cell wall biosynthesis